ncbi:MAG: mechanosensitive ion channel [Desulforegulaceae bacterium]|nr:mechanosensitive ion channel [Desulforegulaceae bacterium]
MSIGNNNSHVFKTMDMWTFIEIAIIVIAAVIIIAGTQRGLRWIAGRLHGQKKLTLLALVPFVRLFIIIGSFMFIVPLIIEPSFQNMVAFLGTAGLAIGFALKDYASSLIAGIAAVGERNYRNGDWIKVGGIYGEVYNVGMRTVEVITPGDDRVLIPHSMLWNQPVINSNNGEPRLQCAADFYTGHFNDTKKVVEILEDVALTSPYLFFNSSVKVVANEKPWGTHYCLKAYPVSSSLQFSFISDLTIRGKSALIHNGVKFPEIGSFGFVAD